MTHYSTFDKKKYDIIREIAQVWCLGTKHEELDKIFVFKRYIQVFFLHICMYVHFVYAMPMEASRGHWILWNWTCRCL